MEYWFEKGSPLPQPFQGCFFPHGFCSRPWPDLLGPIANTPARIVCLLNFPKCGISHIPKQSIVLYDIFSPLVQAKRGSTSQLVCLFVSFVCFSSKHTVSTQQATNKHLARTQQACSKHAAITRQAHSHHEATIQQALFTIEWQKILLLLLLCLSIARGHLAEIVHGE